MIYSVSLFLVHILSAWLQWTLMLPTFGFCMAYIIFYYMEESVLLGTKPLIDSIRHFIRDPSGVFSVCHLCECRIVQWRHDSRLLLLLNCFLHIIKRTLHVGSKIWILHVLAARTISHEWAALTREILFLPLEHKIHIFSPPCNILYILYKLHVHMGGKVTV